MMKCSIKTVHWLLIYLISCQWIDDASAQSVNVADDRRYFSPGSYSNGKNSLPVAWDRPMGLRLLRLIGHRFHLSGPYCRLIG